MNRELLFRRIVDMSEEELVALNYLGDDAFPGIRAMVEKVRANPKYLKEITCFQISRMVHEYTQAAGATRRKTEIPSVQLSTNSAALTVVAPHVVSEFEKEFWYHGLSSSPPKLMYRSDLETNHFPHPQIGDRFFKIPIKTAYGVFKTPLNGVWDTVAPRIVDLLKSRGIKYSSLKTARFSTVVEEHGEEIFGPVVVWIAVWHNTTSAEAVRDVTPEVLHILNDVQVTGVVVEWYESGWSSLSHGR